jgi:hypothetical protein
MPLTWSGVQELRIFKLAPLHVAGPADAHATADATAHARLHLHSGDCPTANSARPSRPAMTGRASDPQTDAQGRNV